MITNVWIAKAVLEAWCITIKTVVCTVVFSQAYARSLREYPPGCLKEAIAALTEVLKVRMNGLAETHRNLFDATQVGHACHDPIRLSAR